MQAHDIAALADGGLVPGGDIGHRDTEDAIKALQDLFGDRRIGIGLGIGELSEICD